MLCEDTALAVGAAHPELTLGVASLNGAGAFSPTAEEAAAAEARERARAQRGPARVLLDDSLEALSTAAQRAAAYVGLMVTKQPLRIKQVLQQVYPIRPEMADDELVASIAYPAEDAPGLAPPGQIPEIFYRIVTRNARGGAEPVDDLIGELQAPLLLLWGESDPWLVSAIGDRWEQTAQSLGKDVARVSVRAGHCPMDEAPEEVNDGLLDFAARLTADAA